MMLEKLFGFDRKVTSVRTEVIAGITTFLTMAYILAINPNVLSATGMDKGALFTTTVIASAFSTLLMAFYAKLPFSLAPGMGLSTFFAYTVCLTMGYTWQFALTAVLIEGIIFILLTVSNLREKIVNAIPETLKHAIGAGIGLFISFIGLQNARIIVNNDVTLLGLGDITSGPALLGIIGLVFTFLFVDMFDTIGTLVGVITKAGMVDKDGKIPCLKQAFLVDAIGTTVGAMLGTSTIVTLIESTSGVGEGGRSGLTAFVTAVCFLLALFLAPFFLAVPAAATAPVLILVGVMMMGAVLKIDFTDYSEAIPAFICILFMPLAYSISDGIVLGMIGYVLINLLTGKYRKLTVGMYILAAIFVLKFLI